MEPCDFIGCQNPVDKSEWAWRMCDECYYEGLDIEDSEVPE